MDSGFRAVGFRVLGFRGLGFWILVFSVRSFPVWDLGLYDVEFLGLLGSRSIVNLVSSSRFQAFRASVVVF